MVEVFDEDGIRFRFPETWKLERENNDSGWSISLQSKETAFLVLCLNEDGPDIQEMADEALAALREEYEDLEAEECVESVGGQPAVGHNIRFFSFDLTNTCWTRSFYTTRGSVLLLCQLNDLECNSNEPILRAICASIEVDD